MYIIVYGVYNILFKCCCPKECCCLLCEWYLKWIVSREWRLDFDSWTIFAILLRLFVFLLVFRYLYVCFLLSLMMQVKVCIVCYSGLNYTNMVRAFLIEKHTDGDWTQHGIARRLVWFVYVFVLAGKDMCEFIWKQLRWGIGKMIKYIGTDVRN